MKLNETNVKKVCNLVLERMEDENGRGEFDSETNIRDAFNFVIDWMEWGDD